jgi:branched-chain amino acid transport system substrate-binding protein
MGRAARVGWGLAVAVTLLALSGCGSGSDGDPRLTVYLSAPTTGPSADDARDIADGARLALADVDGEAAGVPVDLKVLDDAAGGVADAAQAGANARQATQDSTAIAYIGELDSGTTRTSLPITNEAGMLQVSASASADDLTRQAPGSDQIPAEVQPSGSRSFGRVIPSDTAQGAAAAVWMKQAGVTSAEFLSAEGPYGDALLDGFESVSSGPSIAASGGRTGGLYVASGQPELDVLDTHGDPMLFGADAQLTGSPPQSALPAPIRIVSGPLAPSQLPAAGGQFRTDFQGAYDRDPGRFAAYGYEAMAVVLDSISRADEPLDRGSVIDAFFATADRDSILGQYSIDGVGDTTLVQVGAYEKRRGQGELREAGRPITVP